MNNTNKSFAVTLVNEAKGLKETIQVTEEEYILDVAEAQNISLPHSCCNACCFDCLGKVIEGQVDQTAKALSFLKPDEIEAGYVLICAAFPTSNCTILTHQEEEYLS
ncbi:ferredoxin, (2Fe-2S) [Xenococcus sp. PCC 7305]|uniref:2Fe-2S iron-sulfur cluster-binding protein n=1 Tax=Xenococcus sp. PCC 7305 TaxID=102125 RepID=UPI0002AC39AA|nr:2Fe-2S iron-sulfur cluster-binding protein [Xenococcus sp. PCC 7305]ELS00376.1 ferredoxin, (2Fe-2S) [Xenococcus sp. PCC 7305]